MTAPNSRPWILGITAGDRFDADHWRRVLGSGLDALMIREKQLEARALLDRVRWVQDQAPTLPIWVNGRLDIALRTGTGYHAPESHPPISVGDTSLSLPLHAARQASERFHADQWIVSPLFSVPGKGAAWGPGGLHAWLDRLPTSHPPILALGGILPHNVALLRHPRLAGVALMRSLWAADDPRGLVGFIREALS